MNTAIYRICAALKVRELEARERGATAVEYGMLVALIAAVIITAVALLGGQINTAFGKITKALGDNAGTNG